MFERYTEKARRVIFFARYEASTFGSPFIEPEHLLLGIAREDKALFAQLLQNRVDALVGRIRNEHPTRERISTSVDLPLSHSAKRVLAYGAEETERLAQKYIGTAHLLLGVLREDSLAKHVLEEYGVTVERVREHVIRALPDSEALFRLIQSRFAPLTTRLTHEIEPAVVFYPGKQE